MMHLQAKNRRRSLLIHRGLSMAEAVVAMVIISVLLTASLRSVAAARTAEALSANRRIGMELAEDLLAEIMACAYLEPGFQTTPHLGVDSPESAGSRTGFDDVDDYHQWSCSPPKNKNDNLLADLTGWTRRVQVDYVDPFVPDSVRSTDRGVKRIIVSVYKDDRETARLVGYRARTWVQQEY